MQLDRATAGQALVVASMEPAGYYPCLDNPAFMGLFDLEMSYRLQARLPTESAFRDVSQTLVKQLYYHDASYVRRS